MGLAPDPAILRGAEMFASLSDEELAGVLKAGRVRRLSRGEHAFAQGDPGVTCHSLLHGRIKILQTLPDGGQQILRFIGPGDMFGSLAALMGQPFPADAIAVVDSVEVYWSTETMRGLMARFPAIAERTMAATGKRLIELQNRVGELSGERVERRIAHALLRLVRQAGRATSEGVEIDFPITRRELASMSGSTLHTASRTLSAWEDEGIVTGSRRHIVVLKPKALAAMAEGAEEPEPAERRRSAG
jgi:CRP-like cAMP-binding protein